MPPATRESMSPRPDFTALFPVRECGCGREDCEICVGWQLTPNQDSGWRRQVARACDDLGNDLVCGDWPMPRNNAEEIVLHLAIEDGPDCLEEREDVKDQEHDALPRYGDDYDWGMCSEVLFQDHDVLMLYDQSLDGIEDPGSDANEYLRMGDMRPGAWFGYFNNVEPRPASRGFRR